MGTPVIVTMLVVVLYNMADLFFIGKTGDYRQMAAVSLVSPIFVILMACGTLIGGGGCVAISLAMGKKQDEDVKALSSLCAMLSVAIGIIFTIVILCNRNMVLTMLGMGINFGVQPVLSYNYGAGNIKRTREIYFKTAIVGTLVCVILTAACFLGREAIVKMFLSEASFVAFSKKVAGIYLISATIYGIFYLGTTFLQATGKVLLSTLISVMRQGIVFIPLLFIMNKLKGIDGVIYSGVAADVIAGVFGTGLSLVVLYKFSRSDQNIETGDIKTVNIEDENIEIENTETENIEIVLSNTDVSMY